MAYLKIKEFLGALETLTSKAESLRTKEMLPFPRVK